MTEKRMNEIRHWLHRTHPNARLELKTDGAFVVAERHGILASELQELLAAYQKLEEIRRFVKERE
jgi:hypothetical protein